MKTLKEQRGYALIIVLLIITIIGIFTPLIMNKLLNNTHQFQKTEEKMQLNKLSDMGVIYVEHAIDKAGEDASIKVSRWLQEIQEKQENDPNVLTPTDSEIAEKYKQFFESELDTYIPNRILIQEMSEQKYQFKIEIDPPNLENDNTIDVSYTITPSLDTKFDEKNTKTGHKTISIKISG